MIGISKLYCGMAAQSDALRYGHPAGPPSGSRPRRAAGKKPVVVWNCTRACNLQCIHCYAHAGRQSAENELSLAEGRALIDDLVLAGVPVLLFSGGEPLCRADLPELVAYAAGRGLRAVVSTNGTLIDDAMAARLKNAGLAYAGISLDGLRGTNDRFRGRPGAFDLALAGMRACRRAGLKVGLRFTLTRHNLADLPGVFDLIRAEDIPRACFYHMVYSGRAADLQGDDLSHAQARQALDLIMERTADLLELGRPREILTVDNHCDGPYIHLRLRAAGRREDAARVLRLLARAGGNSSGQGIGCVGWDGTVYPDQFLRNIPLG
ncbi:MAG: radical SAM protein, partial [Kiritimatiellia bacterium]